MIVAASQTSNLVVALIALTGAIVGGLITTVAQLYAERRREKKEREANSAVVNGVARVMALCFEVWAHSFHQLADEDKWWNTAVEPSPKWSDQDVQVLSAAITFEQWESISTALVALATLDEIRATYKSSDLSYEDAFWASCRPGAPATMAKVFDVAVVALHQLEKDSA